MRIQHVVLTWQRDVAEKDKRSYAIKNKIVCTSLHQADEVVRALELADQRAERCVQFHISTHGNVCVPADVFGEVVENINTAWDTLMTEKIGPKISIAK